MLARPLAFLLLVAAALPLPAAADPPEWSGLWQVRERYHRPSDDEQGYRVVYAPQPRVADTPDGEPDGERIPVARGLPFGFNRGTCDRALLAAQVSGGVAVPGEIGRDMDQSDRDCLRAALEALPDDRPIAWLGESGALFWMVAERTYIESEIACRQWRATTRLAGRIQQTFGTFCRRSDGQWVWAG